jgi:hypothetical protein
MCATFKGGLVIGGFESRRGLGIFLFTTAFRPGLGPTQPPIQWVPGVKQPGREAITPLPKYAFIAILTNKFMQSLTSFVITLYIGTYVTTGYVHDK